MQMYAQLSLEGRGSVGGVPRALSLLPAISNNDGLDFTRV